jgi:hypothetical protein
LIFLDVFRLVYYYGIKPYKTLMDSTYLLQSLKISILPLRCVTQLGLEMYVQRDTHLLHDNDFMIVWGLVMDCLLKTKLCLYNFTNQ